MKSTMLIQTANSDKRSDLPIEINNCGCYTDINIDTEINRPQGRSDYQLLLITSGAGYFTFNGTEISVGSGNMVLYLPKSRRSTVLIKTPGPPIIGCIFPARRSKQS